MASSKSNLKPAASATFLAFSYFVFTTYLIYNFSLFKYYGFTVMKWTILYAVEREVELDADNINVALEKAEQEKRSGECIVGIRSKRFGEEP